MGKCMSVFTNNTIISVFSVLVVIDHVFLQPLPLANTIKPLRLSEVSL